MMPENAAAAMEIKLCSNQPTYRKHFFTLSKHCMFSPNSVTVLCHRVLEIEPLELSDRKATSVAQLCGMYLV